MKGADREVCSFFCLGLDGCIDDGCLGLFRGYLECLLVEAVVHLEMEFQCDTVSVDSLNLRILAPKLHLKNIEVCLINNFLSSFIQKHYKCQTTAKNIYLPLDPQDATNEPKTV